VASSDFQKSQFHSVWLAFGDGIDVPGETFAGSGLPAGRGMKPILGIFRAIYGELGHGVHGLVIPNEIVEGTYHARKSHHQKPTHHRLGTGDGGPLPT
jgi:hypothetical protein